MMDTRTEPAGPSEKIKKALHRYFNAPLRFDDDMSGYLRTSEYPQPVAPGGGLEEIRLFQIFEENLEKSIDKIRFGQSLALHEKAYRIASPAATRKFWQRYQSSQDLNGHASSMDEYRNLTINGRQRRNERLNSFVKRQVAFFEQIAKTRAEDYERNQSTIIAGPVGAGKSAFSKIVFTHGREKFWDKGLVPTRVEFSKIKRSDVTSYVLECIFRDLLIYCFERKAQEFDELLTNSGNHELIASAINFTYRAKSNYFKRRGAQHQDKHWFLRYCKDYEDATKNMQRLNAKALITIIATVSKEFGIKFVVSFDGFDLIDVHDIIHATRAGKRLHQILNLIRGGEARDDIQEIDLSELKIHYIYFLRDTTWSYAYHELSRDQHLARRFSKIYWIVPPSYAQIAERKIRLLRRAFLLSDNEKALFDKAAKTLWKTLQSYGRASGIQNDFIEIFGDNIRKTERHLHHFTLSLLRLCIARRSNLRSSKIRRKEGCIAFAQWLTNTRILPYIVTQSLLVDHREGYSNCTRIAHGNMDDLFEAPNWPDFLQRITLLSTSGKIDNVFNYFSRATPAQVVRTPDGAVNGLSFFLYNLRALQLLLTRKVHTVGELDLYLGKLGYRSNDGYPTELSSVLLLRSQLAGVKAADHMDNTNDLHFYCTRLGAFIVEKLIYDIAYLGRIYAHTILPSELWNSDKLPMTDSDRRVRAIWDIGHAAILVQYAGFIEDWERRQWAKSGQNPSEFDETFTVYDGMKMALIRQAQSIFSEAATSDSPAAHEAMQRVINQLEEEA